MLKALCLVGTFAPKKGSSADDPDAFPFSKLGAAEIKLVRRGWMKGAVRQIYKTGHWVQCFVWLDRKFVGFVTTALVGTADSFTVERSTKGGGFKKLTVDSHPAVGAYMKSYGGVDRADRGMANFSVAHRCRRWYMCIVFWLLDAVLWNMWVVVKYAYEAGTEPWSQYKPTSGGPIKGRLRFQLDLSNALMEYAAKNALKDAGGIRADVKWLNHSGETRFRGQPAPLLIDHTAVYHTDSNRYCQQCYSKTETSWSKGERRKGCNSTLHKCQECGMRLCRSCWGEIHGTNASFV